MVLAKSLCTDNLTPLLKKGFIVMWYTHMHMHVLSITTVDGINIEW